jgi:hypothetical protein
MFNKKTRKTLGDILPVAVHKQASKGLARPFLWANKREKQNLLTRAIRALWRSL